MKTEKKDKPDAVDKLISDIGEETKGCLVARGFDKNDALSPGNKPEIKLISGERFDAVLRCCEILAEDEKEGSLYRRGQQAVALQMATDGDRLRGGRDGVALPKDYATLVSATAEHAMGTMDRTIKFTKEVKGEEKDKPKTIIVDTPRQLAALTLTVGDLRPIAGITRAPTLRSDGSILDRPGYDKATGLYYAPNAEFLPVPEHPTREDARKTLACLRRPIRGFSFATPADEAVALAEVLTFSTRHLVKCTPAFIHNAKEAGSGKTKLADTISVIALGARALNQTAAVLGNPEELRKVMTSLTMAGAPVILFDNAERGSLIDSPGLNQFLTASLYGDRLLGKNEALQASTTTVVIVTGNNVLPKGDMGRRALVLTLDANEERPELRRFDFDCEAEAERDRPELIRAALTLLRAHALAGRPTPDRPALGSFEEWDRIVCGALVWAGAPDPLQVMAASRADDPERDELGALLGALHRQYGGEWFKAGAVLSLVNIYNRPKDALHDAVLAVAVDPSTRRAEAKRLGYYLKGNEGRIVNKLRLFRGVDQASNTNKYRVEPI